MKIIDKGPGEAGTIARIVKKLRDLFEDSAAKTLLVIWLAGAAAVLAAALSPQEGRVAHHYGYKSAETGEARYDTATMPAGTVSAADAARTVNINTASEYELAAVLPGIGEKKACAIVKYRELIGGFDSVDELTEVEGISEGLLEKIRPYCRTDDKAQE